MTQQAVRISTELVEAARIDAVVEKRSISGQIEHWADIGRLVVGSPDFDYGRVKRALRAEIAFDDLSGREQVLAIETLFDEEDEPTAEETAFFVDMNARGVGVGLAGDGTLDYGSNEPTAPTPQE